MRRFVAAGLMAIVSAGTSLGQTTPADQLLAANELFAAGLDNDGFADGKYYEAMITDIAGTWVDGSSLLTPGIEATKVTESIGNICERFQIAITAPAPLTLRMTLIARGLQVPTTYVYVGGTSFAAITDTISTLTRAGILDRMKEQPRLAVGMMPSQNGVFSLYRVSPDVFAIVSDNRPPRLVVRCNSVTPVVETADGPDDAALKEAIGKAFDDQFGADADPAKRQTFIDCALAVFSPLSPEDRKLVVDTGFNPPSPDRERIETSYPGLAEGATGCAEAADSSELP